MIQPFINQLAKRKIILASSSPRRQQILQTVGLVFEVVPSTFEENLDPKSFSSPVEFVKETAKQKTLEVSERLKSKNVEANLIIGADTIVTLENEIFGKPHNEQDAMIMLEKLNGKNHMVHTAVTLILPKSSLQDEPDNLVKTFYEGTEVVMTSMSADIIESYVKTKEPLDKAGGYGIQGIGGSLIERIHGDYYNVMGFPLHKFCKEIYDLCKQGLI